MIFKGDNIYTAASWPKNNCYNSVKKKQSAETYQGQYKAYDSGFKEYETISNKERAAGKDRN